jgi:RNA polymerase sigma-70 factor (ECF subfamily)
VTDTAASVDAGPFEAVFRDVFGHAVAILIRVFGDITLAEDAAQDAFVVAMDRWPIDGVPVNPTAWIVTTGKRRAIDALRRSARGRELESELAVIEARSIDAHPGREDGPVHDDRLRLIFTCCHPALRPENGVALTLRLLGGLSVADIARAFLVSDAAMAKRLVRAKYKIKAAGIPYRVPDDADLPARLRSVLSVLYLIYTSGLAGDDRVSLRHEAIRLARELATLMPDEPEVAGLLALMLLSESRARARIVDGDPVLLRDQDRATWDPSMIEEGKAIVRACIRRGAPGPYQLQAAIQAVHSDAGSIEETDWRQVFTLYDQLLQQMPTPVVAMNRALVLAELEGPDIALGALNELAADLDAYHLLHAARGTMLRRLGRIDDARAAFERAALLATSDTDRRSLARELDALEDPGYVQ